MKVKAVLVAMVGVCLILASGCSKKTPKPEKKASTPTTSKASTPKEAPKNMGEEIAVPMEYRVKCIACDAEWMIKPEEVKHFHREMEMGGLPVGGDCPKCSAKGVVYIMIKCPNCGAYYLLKRYEDPEAYAGGNVKDECPECGQDLREWYKKHRRKR